MWAIY
ncbi:uncharacterized protein FFNC_10876 [Fusarium fujikuroi]